MPAPQLSGPELLDKQHKDKQAKEVEDRHVKEATKGAELLSETSAFRFSTDAPPTNQTTNDQVREINNQIGQTNGIGSTGKIDSFTTADGKTITGQTYTSKEGTFLIAPGGADGKGTKYQIEASSNGGDRTISRVDSDGKKEAVALRPATPAAASSSLDASLAAAPAAPQQTIDAGKKDAPKDSTILTAQPQPATDATRAPAPITDVVPHPAPAPGSDGLTHPPAPAPDNAHHPTALTPGSDAAAGGGGHPTTNSDGSQLQQNSGNLKDTGKGQSVSSSDGSVVQTGKPAPVPGAASDTVAPLPKVPPGTLTPGGEITPLPKVPPGSGAPEVTTPAPKAPPGSGAPEVTTPLPKVPPGSGAPEVTTPAPKAPSGSGAPEVTTPAPKAPPGSGAPEVTTPAPKAPPGSGAPEVTTPAPKAPQGSGAPEVITPAPKAPPGSGAPEVITPAPKAPPGVDVITPLPKTPSAPGSQGGEVITAPPKSPIGQNPPASDAAGNPIIKPNPIQNPGSADTTSGNLGKPSQNPPAESTTGLPGKPTSSNSSDTNLGNVINKPTLPNSGDANLGNVSKPSLPNSGDANLGNVSKPTLPNSGDANLGNVSKPSLPNSGDANLGNVSKPTLPNSGDANLGNVVTKPTQNQPNDGSVGAPIIKNPNLPVDGSIASSPVRQPGDSNVTQVQKPGTDVNTLKPGGDAASGTLQNLPRPSLPTDVLAPTPAQTVSLKLAGFDINNPTDASFLAAARAQLMAGRMGDGTNANTTLANALSGANITEVNKLAAFMTTKPDAQAQNVVLDQANLAKLNALFRPEALSGVAGLPATLDVKNLAGRGVGEFLAAQTGPVAQKDIYNELNKIASQLMHPTDISQKLSMVDLVARTVTKPLEPALPSTLLGPTKVETVAVIKPETLVVKPENAAAATTALAEARTRAAEMAELTPVKPVAHVAARSDIAEGIGSFAIAKALTPGTAANQPADGKFGLDPHLGGIKPNTLTTSEGMANTRAAEEAVRVAAARATEIEIKSGQGGSNMTLAPRSETAEIADKHVDAKKKKPDEKGEQGGISIDASMLTGAALRIFDTKGEDKKEDTSAAKKDEENKAQRRKYVVKQNDSLESIAVKTFRDPRLAALIAAVNSEVIARDADPRAPLSPGQTLWLPSESEMLSFFESLSAQASEEQLSPEEELARRFGNGWDGGDSKGSSSGPFSGPNTEPVASLMDAAVMATIKRRENVEKLLGPLPTKKVDQINYTVRLGDSLKSIAMKHPALQDVSLWELVAKVNDIKVPGKDPSAVKLTRGTTLRLPSQEEVSEYRALPENKKPTPNTSVPPTRTGPRSIVLPPGNPFAVNNGPPSTIVDEHAITRVSAPIRDAGASLLRAGGFVKDQIRTADDAATIVTAPLDRLPRPEISKPVTTDKPAVENIKILSPDCRVVRKHQVDNTGRLYQAQLEVLYGGEWKSVMMYNISDGNCWRKSINEVGVTEILQLELPVPAIHQMLESDFANNWEEHRDRFINSIDSF